MTRVETMRPSATMAWLAATILFVTWLTAFIDRFILLLLVPSLKLSLGISDTQIALLNGPAFSLVFAVAGLALGRFVDTVNRRNLLAAGLVGWSLAAIGCGLANGFGALFATRLAMGACQAVLAPVSFSLIADLFPAERRGKPTAIVASGAAVGAALSSFIGGTLLQALSARPPIVLPVVGALAPWQGTLVLAGLPGLVVALLFTVFREPARTSVVAGTGAPGFHLKPYLRRNLALFALLLLGFGFQFMAGYGVASWFAALLMRDGGLQPASAGLLMGSMTLFTGISAGLVGGWLSDRVGRADIDGGRLRLAIGCILLQAVAFLPLLAPHSIAALISCYIPYAVLSTIVAALSYTILPDLVPGAGRGRILSLHQLIAAELGLGLGPTMIALMTDHVFRSETMLNYSIMGVAIPCSLIAALMLGLALPRARRLRAALERGDA